MLIFPTFRYCGTGAAQEEGTRGQNMLEYDDKRHLSMLSVV